MILNLKNAEETELWENNENTHLTPVGERSKKDDAMSQKHGADYAKQ